MNLLNLCDDVIQWSWGQYVVYFNGNMHFDVYS